MAKAEKSINEGELRQFNCLFSLGLFAVGVDLASTVIQVCYYDPKSKQIKNRQLKRDEFYEFIKAPEFGPMQLCIEACGSCNYWSREFVKYGHSAKVVLAKDVKPFIMSSDKNDKLDARGLFKCCLTETLGRTVKPKDESQQTILNLHTVRSLLIKQLVQTQNSYRAMIYELGGVSKPQSINRLKLSGEEMLAKLQDENSDAVDNFNCIKEALTQGLDNTAQRLKVIDGYLHNFAHTNEDCKRLMTIPGIAEISATAIYAVMGDPDNFENGAQFAALAGFVPAMVGTGGREYQLSTRRSANPLLKGMIYICAVSQLAKVAKHDKERKSQLAIKLDHSDAKKKVIVAVANRLCKVAWAVTKYKKDYDPTKCGLLF